MDDVDRAVQVLVVVGHHGRRGDVTADPDLQRDQRERQREAVSTVALVVLRHDGRDARGVRA